MNEILNKNNNLVMLNSKRVKNNINKKNNNNKQRRAIFLMVILVLAYFVYAVGLPIMETGKLNKEIVKVEEEIKNTKAKNKELKEKMNLLKTDTYVERIAREKLGYVKPGEILIIPAESGESKALDTKNPLY